MDAAHYSWAMRPGGLVVGANGLCVCSLYNAYGYLAIVRPNQTEVQLWHMDEQMRFSIKNSSNWAITAGAHAYLHLSASAVDLIHEQPFKLWVASSSNDFPGDNMGGMLAEYNAGGMSDRLVLLHDFNPYGSEVTFSRFDVFTAPTQGSWIH